MGWSQLWLETAQGTKLTDGLIGLMDDTITALPLLNNAWLRRDLQNSLPLAKIPPVSCCQRARAFLTLSLDLGHNS